MRAILGIISVSIATVLAQNNTTYSLDEADQLFIDFIKKYNRQYETVDERKTRFEMFKKNLEIVNALNAEARAVSGENNFGINELIDLTDEEFESQYLGFAPDELFDNFCPSARARVDKDVPKEWDWREKHIVSTPKAQAKCGACWAFSAIALDSAVLKLYTGGVLQTCKAGKVNHAVLLVGYGEENNVPYWVIKNSWGPNWGEEGFLRLIRGRNACNMILYPMVASEVK